MGMSDSGFEALEPDIGAIPEITTLKQEHGEGGLAGNRLGRLSGECVAQLPTSVPSERLRPLQRLTSLTTKRLGILFEDGSANSSQKAGLTVRLAMLPGRYELMPYQPGSEVTEDHKCKGQGPD